MIIETILAILVATAPLIPQIVKRIDKWSYRRQTIKQRQEYIEQNREYIEQVNEMKAKYHPERPDVELAMKCKEYLSEVFPYGVENKTRDMSQEELIEFFKQLEKDAELEALDQQITALQADYDHYHAYVDPAFHLDLEQYYQGLK